MILGLASYILEKFSTWTNKAGRQVEDGNLLEFFTLDDLLNNVMVYWINGNIIPSQRYYKENLAGEAYGLLSGVPIENVPVGLAAFPGELFVQPKNYKSHKNHQDEKSQKIHKNHQNIKIRKFTKIIKIKKSQNSPKS